MVEPFPLYIFGHRTLILKFQAGVFIGDIAFPQNTSKPKERIHQEDYLYKPFYLMQIFSKFAISRDSF